MSISSRIARLEKQRPQAIEYPPLMLKLEDGREMPFFSAEAINFLGWGCEGPSTDPTEIAGIYLATWLRGRPPQRPAAVRDFVT